MYEFDLDHKTKWISCSLVQMCNLGNANGIIHSNANLILMVSSYRVCEICRIVATILCVHVILIWVAVPRDVLTNLHEHRWALRHSQVILTWVQQSSSSLGAAERSSSPAQRELQPLAPCSQKSAYSALLWCASAQEHR